MLKIEIQKSRDGSGVMRCIRADMSVAWQREVRHAEFFALHDLTHYAAETVLGYRQGFFVLLESGWEFEDVDGKGARGPLPAETIEVEGLVGLLDTERGTGVPMTLDQFNAFAPRPLTPTELDAVRNLRAELFQRWSDVEPGQFLRLQFHTPP